METTTPTTPQRNRLLIAGATIGAVALFVAAVGVWWFLQDDAPSEVSLAVATESVETDGADDSGDAAGQNTTATSDADVTGTWTIDTDTGDFDYESATGSFVGFRIDEELRSIGSTTAVGRTAAITGTIGIDGTTLVEAAFEIDLTTITTETTNRDDNVQDALETGDFPTATFALTQPIELGDAAVAGEPVTTKATGDLTLHGVTQSVEFDLEAQLVDGTIVVVGSTDIVFADYGVEVPDGGPVISVDDFGILELQLLFIR